MTTSLMPASFSTSSMWRSRSRLSKNRRASVRSGALVGSPKASRTAIDAARGFGNRSIFDEQGPPDQVGLFACFGSAQYCSGRIGDGAEEFGFQIVIGQQFIDSPKPEVAERGHEEVGVDVDKRRSTEFLFDNEKEILAARVHGIKLRRSR